MSNHNPLYLSQEIYVSNYSQNSKFSAGSPENLTDNPETTNSSGDTAKRTSSFFLEKKLKTNSDYRENLEPYQTGMDSFLCLKDETVSLTKSNLFKQQKNSLMKRKEEQPYVNSVKCCLFLKICQNASEDNSG